MVSRLSRTVFQVLVERKTRLVKITKIPANTSLYVSQAIVHRLATQLPRVLLFLLELGNLPGAG